MFKKLIYSVLFVLALGLFLTSIANAADPNLVGWWKMDEGSGATAIDSSGNGFDIPLQNNTWGTGKFGGALHFPGEGQGQLGGFNYSNNAITVCAWVWHEAFRSGQVERYVTAEPEAAVIRKNSDGQLHFYINTGGTLRHLYVGNVLTEGQWYHVAGTWDGLTQLLYIDGVEIASQTPGGVLVSTSGVRLSNAPEPLNGMLDDVRIYNRALTPDEIRGVMLGGGAEYPLAFDPTPADEAVLTSFPGGILGTSLSWKPGDFAVSHDVYFGTDFDNVNEGASDTFRGNQTATYFLAGYGYTPNDPAPTGFVPGTTYYWRIDEVNDANDESPWKGNVWSFSLPATKAYNPSPGDGVKFVDTDADLSWVPGFGAIAQTVYFGDDYDTVSTATTGGTGVGTPTYDPGPLEPEKTFYWRVDAIGAFGPATGDVWSFTTARLGGGLKGDYYHWSGDFPPSQPFQIFVLSRTDPQINFSWGEGSPDPLVNINNFACRWIGEVEAAFTETYTFYTTTDDGARLWINDQQIIEQWVEQGDTEWSGTIDLVAGQKYSIEMHHYENGGGATAQLRWSSPNTPKQIIPQAAFSPPVNASGPNPANGATGVKMTPTLTWNPGEEAVSHQVYFGTDPDAVLNATTASPEYIGTRALGDESYEPGKLAWDSTYYWRIDEVNNLNPDSPWIGNLWSFTTGDFLVVDNIEDYDAEDQIWWHWVDGLGYVKPDNTSHPGNGSGSEVGDASTPSFTEETIVHGGSQSMPFKYNNNDPFKLKYSEAKLTLSNTRDWTEEGVKALSLWFQGRPGSTGSFTDNFDTTYSMTGSGADIWDISGIGTGFHDEFHFAYKTLTGAGTIIARVDSVSATNDWAKAGVMIRETLDPNSAHAFACVTPASGVSFQRRPSTGAASSHETEADLIAPYWVRLERDMGGNFTVTRSVDGSTWEAQGTVQNIPMNTNVYVGLALTSHDVALTCEAAFSSVTITGNVTGQWASQDIGILSNDAEPLYVAIANNTGQPAVVVHEDPNAAQIDTWTEWNIDLKDFAGINLADVNSIAVGLGNRNNPQAGGSGKMYFDDFALYQPRYVPGKGTQLAADLNGDGVVDYRDVRKLASQWLFETQQFQDWDHRVAYWDADYPTAWADVAVTEAVRDYLALNGYTVVDAAQLKTWMDARIADGTSSVVVFCKDIVPDTVAETMDATCTIRQYLDAGGKVVWYSDWPFYYQGLSDGTSAPTWGPDGAINILGFDASGGPNDSGEEVVITAAGTEWGLTTTWTSQRPTPPVAENLTALATITGGSAAAWAKHYVPGDYYRGFFRIADFDVGPGDTDLLPDLLSVAESKGALVADLNQDGVVNFKDHAVLADQWLDEQLWPEE